MEEVKQEEDLLNHDKQRLLLHYKQLKNNNGAADVDVEKARRNQEVLNRLHSQGIIDSSGKPVQGRP